MKLQNAHQLTNVRGYRRSRSTNHVNEFTIEASLQSTLKKAMVPTFVSGHMFCASRKAWFTRYARARVDIDVINYATNYATKMKAKCSYCEQIKFNESVRKLGTPG